MPHDLTDIGPVDGCSSCERDIDLSSWFWYADAGSAHLTFCRECGADYNGADWDHFERATGVVLNDDCDAFVRIIGIGDYDWGVA